MRLFNLKKSSNRYMPEKEHRSYGIQNWLLQRNFCTTPNAKWKIDPDKYVETLKSFCLYDNPEFDFTKSQDIVKSMESYVQRRFTKFCNYCFKKLDSSKALFPPK